MKLIAILIIVLLTAGCVTLGHEANCIESAAVACSIMARAGHDVIMAIQKTDKEGVYHAQCMALDGNEWRWVVLDSYPTAYWGEREHGIVVEYWQF